MQMAQGSVGSGGGGGGGGGGGAPIGRASGIFFGIFFVRGGGSGVL